MSAVLSIFEYISYSLYPRYISLKLAGKILGMIHYSTQLLTFDFRNKKSPEERLAT
jgi:hypothetical protein